MKQQLRATATALVVFATAGLAPTLPATAQKLPWSDANPLEKLFGKPRKAPAHRHQNRRPAAKAPEKAKAPGGAEVLESAAVPVPDKRPELPAAAVAAGGVAAAAAVTVGTDAAAKPVADTAATADGSAASKAESAVPAIPSADAVPKPEASPPPPVDAKPEIGSDAAADAAAVPLPEQPANPAATAAKPLEEIPVPDKRPPAPGEPKAEPDNAGVPEVTAPKQVAPAVTKEKAAEEDPAPNSTEKLKARVSAISPAAAVQAAAAVEDAEKCEAELTRRGVEFTIGDSISEGDCGVLRPVSVTRLASGIKVSPKTQMLCRAALALDDWMTNGVVPAAKADLPDRKLTEFRHASTYVCRPRASEKGISEHARGSAIDIAAFVFDKGDEIGVEAKPAGTPEARFQDVVRAAACGPFKTVLGPGTDSDHATHFHLDIAARNNGATYCK